MTYIIYHPIESISICSNMLEQLEYDINIESNYKTYWVPPSHVLTYASPYNCRVIQVNWYTCFPNKLNIKVTQVKLNYGMFIRLEYFQNTRPCFELFDPIRSKLIYTYMYYICIYKAQSILLVCHSLTSLYKLEQIIQLAIMRCRVRP